MRKFLIVIAMAASAAGTLAAQGTPQAPVAMPATPTAQGGRIPAPPAPPATMPAQNGQGGRGQQGGRPGTMPGQAPQAPQPPQPAQAVPPQPPQPDSVPTQNVRMELTIGDTLGGASGTKKTVTMLVADGRNGRIRAGTPGTNYTLNVDARAIVRRDGRIELNLTIEYVPDSPPTDARQRPANINESLSVLVPDGKLMMISQSADPANDRKVTVEVMATIVK